jgi:hypothetical protein
MFIDIIELCILSIYKKIKQKSCAYYAMVNWQECDADQTPPYSF